MELFTQNLPSGYKDYPFFSLRIKPMTFAQVLEYMENLPESPVERFYYDYTVVFADDPNVENLLLSDLEFVVFYKKCITINKDLEYNTQGVCPSCGSEIDVHFSLKQIKFVPLGEDLLNGLDVKFHGERHILRMPKVKQFLRIFSAYRRYKKVSDMNIIKLIALFENTETELQRYETMVVNAVHQDITVLVHLSNYFYKVIEPVTCICKECERNFQRLKMLKMEEVRGRNELDAEIRLNELQQSRYEGEAVSIDYLIANFFRAIVDCNGLDKNQILSREVRTDGKH